jgi:hypothetical protein
VLIASPLSWCKHADGALAALPRQLRGLRLVDICPCTRAWRAEKFNVLADVLIVFISGGLFQGHHVNPEQCTLRGPSAALPLRLMRRFAVAWPWAVPSFPSLMR